MSEMTGSDRPKLNLPPCPFCGSVNLMGDFHKRGDEQVWCFVMCSDCLAIGPPAIDEPRAMLQWTARFLGSFTPYPPEEEKREETGDQTNGHA